MNFLKRLFERKPKPGKPQPTSDRTFDQDVLGAELPVVVDFWASWCPPCQVMGGLLNEIAPEYSGRLKIFKLNIEENPRIAAKYGVSSIPTILFFKNGQITDRIVGLLPLNPLKKKLDELI